MSETGLDSFISNLLQQTSRICPQAFHGGSMNGVCCRRLLTDIEVIMKNIKEKAIEKINNNIHNTYSMENLTKVFDDYINLFHVMDAIFSNLQIPSPSKDEIEEVKLSNYVMENMWRELELSITPKAHILFEHAVDQFEKYGGIADKVEDFVEKAHKEGKRMDHLTSRMPNQCYRQQQLIHIQRMWINKNPGVIKQIEKVRTCAKRQFKDPEQRAAKNKLSINKKQRHMKREDTKTAPFFINKKEV